MKTKETFEFYPVGPKDKAKLSELLCEIVATLSTRADGIKIVVERNDEFPPLSQGEPEKALITGVKIETWDIAA